MVVLSLSYGMDGLNVPFKHQVATPENNARHHHLPIFMDGNGWKIPCALWKFNTLPWKITPFQVAYKSMIIYKKA